MELMRRLGAPGSWRFRSTRFAAVAIAVLALASAAALFGLYGPAASGKAGLQPGTFPAFSMDLTIARGSDTTTARFVYASPTDWSYSEFDGAGVLIESQRLADGWLTMSSRNSEQRIYAGGDDLTVPVAWLLDIPTMLGRGAQQLGASASYERAFRLPCSMAPSHCTGGATDIRVSERVDYDRRSGIPVGYTERVNGVVVMAVRATAFRVGDP